MTARDERDAAFDVVRQHLGELAVAVADTLEPDLVAAGLATRYVRLADLCVFEPPTTDPSDERPSDELDDYLDVAVVMPMAVTVLAMRGHRARLTWHAASDDPDNCPVWFGWWTVTLEDDDWDAGAALRAAQDGSAP